MRAARGVFELQTTDAIRAQIHNQASEADIRVGRRWRMA